MKSVSIANQRKHTLHFLNEIRVMAPVFLDTDVDMSCVLAHRTAARAAGNQYSIVTYVLAAAGRALARHPEANAAVRGRRRLHVVRYTHVNAKLTLDKSIDGHRVVLSVVLCDVERAALGDLQRVIDRFRDCDPARMPEFAGVRLLHRLPWTLGGVLFRAAVRPLSKRDLRFGTVAVTSLGHRPVDSFHSTGGTTITLGVGQIADRPVARNGRVLIAPVMRLSLAFDHRVIDGAEAADVLADVKENLEKFRFPGEADEPDGTINEATATRGMT